MKPITLIPACLALLAFSVGAQAALPAFEEVDTDADGQLNIEEAQSVLSAVYDANGDGIFNVLEAIQAVPDLGKQLDPSTDVDAPVDAEIYAEIAAIADEKDQG